jgi:Zn-dependent M28 family amino/carboxypeptidase
MPVLAAAAPQNAHRATPAAFSGAAALEFTAKAVSFGPRPPGSAAIHKLQAYILSELKKDRCEIVEDNFAAETPLGPIAMKNIIARFPGSSGKIVAITGHYDTKSEPDGHFVGANDGGSSTGLLLEMARAISLQKHKDDIYVVWFDGEEAFAQWSATDGIYGSRDLANQWAATGTLSKIKALINVDMIGDSDLDIIQESGSSGSLNALVWKTAKELGYGSHFLDQSGAVEDDHTPFLARGVNAIDLIDFDYGPQNAYWHTDQDTMDKLSAGSLGIVGNVLVQVLKKLD